MSIIKNYGLRWTREKVEWGSRGKGNEGRLSGKLGTLKSSSEVDFREQIGIYVLYEPGFSPVYIGQAGMGNSRLFQRLKNHMNDHLRDRWVAFSWFGFREVNQDCSLSDKHNPEASTSIKYSDALGEIEGILIQVLEPRLNRQGPKWQQTASEYVQAGLQDASMRLEDLADSIEQLRSEVRKQKT